MKTKQARPQATSRMESIDRRTLLFGLGSFALNACLAGCGAGGSGSGSTASAAADGKSAGTQASGTTSTAAAGSSAASTTAQSSSQGSTTSSKTPASTPASAAASTPVSNAFKFGVFSGGYDPSAAEVYDNWLGRQAVYNVDFLTSDNTGWDLGQWAPLLKLEPQHNMLLSVPMTDMAGNVLGANDTVYQTMAALVKAKYPSAIIRIGWEMNGGWYPWSAFGQEALYRASFNHVAAIFKAESSKFMVEWCPNNGAVSNMDCALAYPGDTYVDCIGMDTYMDYRYGVATSAARWDYIVNNSRGLEWQVSFAKAHGKLLSFPEWGVNSDDPLFVQNMYNWMTANKYDHASYWDSNAAFQGKLSDNQYPHAAAEFKKLFGA